jgi:hypothetical protein
MKQTMPALRATSSFPRRAVLRSRVSKAQLMAARCAAAPALLFLLLSLAVSAAEATEPPSTMRTATRRVPTATTSPSSRPRPLVSESQVDAMLLLQSPPFRQRQRPSTLSRADNAPPQTELSSSSPPYMSPLDSPLYIPGTAAAPASDRAELESGSYQVRQSLIYAPSVKCLRRPEENVRPTRPCGEGGSRGDAR